MSCYRCCCCCWWWRWRCRCPSIRTCRHAIHTCYSQGRTQRFETVPSLRIVVVTSSILSRVIAGISPTSHSQSPLPVHPFSFCPSEPTHNRLSAGAVVAGACKVAFLSAGRCPVMSSFPVFFSLSIVIVPATRGHRIFGMEKGSGGTAATSRYIIRTDSACHLMPSPSSCSFERRKASPNLECTEATT